MPAVPAGPAPVAPTWTLVDVFAGLGVTLLVSTLVITIVGFTGFDGGPGLILVAVLPIWISLAGTTVWACRRHGTGSLVTDLGLRIRWSDLLVGLGVGLGLRVALAIWAYVVVAVTRQMPHDTSNLPDIGDGPPLGTGVWLVVNVVVIAVISPFVEELFFRGLALRSALISLWRRAGRTRFGKQAKHRNQAAWISGVLFGLLHLNEVSTWVDAVILVPGLVGAGWVMARLTLWRQRLGPAIVTHMVFNATAVLALLSIS